MRHPPSVLLTCNNRGALRGEGRGVPILRVQLDPTVSQGLLFADPFPVLGLQQADLLQRGNFVSFSGEGGLTFKFLLECQIIRLCAVKFWERNSLETTVWVGLSCGSNSRLLDVHN